MILSSAQLAVVRMWAQALVTADRTRDEFVLAALGNANFAPDYFVWKSSLGKHEFTYESGIGDNGVVVTSFVWGGTAGGYINRSPGELACFTEQFNATLTCKPNLANVRTAFDDIFSGTGAGAVANRAHFRAKSRRQCSVVEKLFVILTVGGPTQTGNRGTRTNPDTLGAEGPITAQNIVDAFS